MKRLKRKNIVMTLRAECGTDIPKLRDRIEDLIFDKSPNEVFGYYYVKMIWRGCPNSGFAEARICKRSAFAKAAAEFIAYAL